MIHNEKMRNYYLSCGSVLLSTVAIALGAAVKDGTGAGTITMAFDLLITP